MDQEVLGLLETEKRIFEETITALTNQLKESERRLIEEEQRARELTSGIVSTRRVEEKAMLASDEAVSHALKSMKTTEVADIKKLLERPYFARIELEEEQSDGAPIKIGYKLGTISNIDCRIIDWRKAPISKLYYEYKEGDEYSEEIQGRERIGKILTRHAIEANKRGIKSVSCRFGRFEWNGKNWIQVGTGGAKGTGSNSAGEILALITPEQFNLITIDAKSPVLIQGIAGSGKTTVALHRLAWQLHGENSDIFPSEALVVTASEPLRNFILEVLPSLGIEGVAILTFGQWAEFAIKESNALLKLDKIVDTIPTDLEFNHSSNIPRSLKRVRNSTGLFKVVKEQIEKDIQRLWSICGSMLDDARTQNLSPYQFASQQLKRELSPELRATIKNLLNELVDIPKLLLKYYNQVNHIVAADSSNLLTYELVKQSAQHFENMLASNEICIEDAGLLLFLTLKIFGGVPRGAGLWSKIRGLVVDEVQDLSWAELAVITGAIESPRSLTLVGDVGQQKEDRRIWEVLRRSLKLPSEGSSEGGTDYRYVTLTISHRSTLPIMRLADYVSGTNRTTDGRPGRIPLWFKCKDESQSLTEAIRWLKLAGEKFPTRTAAMITNDQDTAKHLVSLLKPSLGESVRLGAGKDFSFDAGVIVTDIGSVKGLEFYSVLIWDPDKNIYTESQEGRNLLYVGLTRAEENLCIISYKNHTKLLPSIDSKYVRGVDLTNIEVE